VEDAADAVGSGWIAGDRWGVNECFGEPHDGEREVFGGDVDVQAASSSILVEYDDNAGDEPPFGRRWHRES